MKLVFNKVTWYSIAFAVVLYVATFLIAFYLGLKFGVFIERSNLRENNNLQQNTSQVKTFTSGNLGVKFAYNSVSEKSQIKVLESGNKIYIYPEEWKPE